MPIGMNTSDLKLYARYSQLGFEMVAPILLGLGVDYLFSTAPWGVVVGAVLSLVYMFLRLRRLMQISGGPEAPSSRGAR